MLKKSPVKGGRISTGKIMADDDSRVSELDDMSKIILGPTKKTYSKVTQSATGALYADPSHLKKETHRQATVTTPEDHFVSGVNSTLNRKSTLNCEARADHGATASHFFIAQGHTDAQRIPACPVHISALQEGANKRGHDGASVRAINAHDVTPYQELKAQENLAWRTYMETPLAAKHGVDSPNALYARRNAGLGQPGATPQDPKTRHLDTTLARRSPAQQESAVTEALDRARDDGGRVIPSTSDELALKQKDSWKHTDEKGRIYTFSSKNTKKLGEGPSSPNERGGSVRPINTSSDKGSFNPSGEWTAATLEDAPYDPKQDTVPKGRPTGFSRRVEAPPSEEHRDPAAAWAKILLGFGSPPTFAATKTPVEIFDTLTKETDSKKTRGDKIDVGGEVRSAGDPERQRLLARTREDKRITDNMRIAEFKRSQQGPSGKQE